MNKAFSHLSFADLSAMESFTIQVLEQIKKSSNGDLIPRYGRFIVIHEKLCEEIFARIEAEENRFFAQEKVPQKRVKNLLHGSPISWLIANIKSEQMKALGMSEEALSDAKETADDLKSGGRPDRANAINRLIRAFFLSLDDVSFPKIDNG